MPIQVENENRQEFSDAAQLGTQTCVPWQMSSFVLFTFYIQSFHVFEKHNICWTRVEYSPIPTFCTLSGVRERGCSFCGKSVNVSAFQFRILDVFRFQFQFQQCLLLLLPPTFAYDASSCTHVLHPQVTKTPKNLRQTGGNSAPVWSKTTPRQTRFRIGVQSLKKNRNRTWIDPMWAPWLVHSSRIWHSHVQFLGPIPWSFPRQDASFWRIPLLSDSRSSTSIAPSYSCLHTGESCIHLHMCHIFICLISSYVSYLHMYQIFICIMSLSSLSLTESGAWGSEREPCNIATLRHLLFLCVDYSGVTRCTLFIDLYSIQRVTGLLCFSTLCFFLWDGCQCCAYGTKKMIHSRSSKSLFSEQMPSSELYETK